MAKKLPEEQSVIAESVTVDSSGAAAVELQDECGCETPTEQIKSIAFEEDEVFTSDTIQIDPAQKQAILDELERTYWFRMGKRVLKDWRLYVMLLPLLLVFLFWRYMPLYGLLNAFKENSVSKLNVLDKDFVGIEFFLSLIVGPYKSQFWQAFRNTFIISFYGLAFGFPFPIILAIFFNEVKTNILRSLFQVITYLPRFVSTVVVTTLIGLLFRAPDAGLTNMQGIGILSKLMYNLGIITRDQAELGVMRLPQFFRAIYQISGIWETAGYNSIVYFAAIIGISPTSYEAAQIDGASKMAQLRYVVLPGISSTIVIMLIINIGGLLNMGYEKVLLMYHTDTYVVADILSTYVLRTSGMAGTASNTNEAMASAADLMAAVISMLLVMGSNMISRKVSQTSLY